MAKINKDARCNRCGKPTESVSDTGLLYLCPECGGRAVGSVGSIAREAAAKAKERKVPPELAETGKWIERNAGRLDLPDGTLWENLPFFERCRRILDLREVAMRERNAEVTGTLETAALGMIERARREIGQRLPSPEAAAERERLDVFTRSVWAELRKRWVDENSPKEPPRAEAARLAGRSPIGDAAASEGLFNSLRARIGEMGSAADGAGVAAAEAADAFARWSDSYGAVRDVVSKAQARGEARVGKIPQGTVDRLAAEAKMRLDEQRAKVEQAERSVEAYGRRRRGRYVGGRSAMEAEERRELEESLDRERRELERLTREAVRDNRAVPVVISRSVINDSKRRLVIAFTYSDGTEVKIPADAELGRADTFGEALADRSAAEVLAVGAFLGDRAGFNLGTKSDDTRVFWNTAMVDARKIRDRWKAAGVTYGALGKNIAAGVPISDLVERETAAIRERMVYPRDPDPRIETVNVRSTIPAAVDWSPREYGAVETVRSSEILNPDAGPRIVRSTGVDFSRSDLAYKVRMEYGGTFVGDAGRDGSRGKVARELPAVIQQRKIDLPE